MKPLNEYAVYKGDELICTGTAKECAEHMEILERSFRFLLSPAYKKRVEERKSSKSIVVVKLDDDE